MSVRFGKISVHPKNWQASNASLKAIWYVQAYAYEPGKPAVQKKFKAGVNRLKTLPERQALIRDMLNELKTVREEADYTGTSEISPYTKFIPALKYAFEKIKIVKKTRGDIKSVIAGMETGAKALGLTNLPIKEVKRKHIKLIMDHLKKSPDRYNKYRTYLMMLFTELIEVEAVETNIIRDMRKQRVTRAPKILLNDLERQRIDKYLYEVNYPFWRFVQVFFHSGQRETELLTVQAKDVNLEAQEYRVLINKGKASHWQVRGIKDIALLLWRELLKDAEDKDYLFSEGLLPGAEAINPEQVTRRWKLWVKRDLRIDKGLYQLKHLNTTETVDALGNLAAASHNGHTSTAMTDSVYDVRNKTRLRQAVKTLSNSFAPTDN